MSSPQQDRIYVIWRQGTIQDPYVDISEPVAIINGIATLSEIPDHVTRVTVNGYFETESTTPKSNEFCVNYQNGIVQFNTSENNKTPVFEYKGRGVIKYPASRIIVQDPNNNTVYLSLQDIINNHADVIETEQTLSEIKAEADEAIANARQATIEAQTATTNAITATENTNVAIDQANEATANANTAAQSANDAATNANTTNTNISNAEQERVTAENNRVSAESNRILAENNRVASEASRETAETNRSIAEAERVTAESARSTAETGRVSAEESRVLAESERISTESERANAELLRIQSEIARVQAEQDRVESENDRINSELSREMSEILRVDAESIRVTNEETRQFNEDVRQANEIARQNAINNLTQVGNWSSSVSYSQRNIVRYGTATYIALSDNTNMQPDINQAVWAILALDGVDGTGTGTVTSVTSANGDIIVSNSTTNPVLTLNSATSGANKILKTDSRGDINLSGKVHAYGIIIKNSGTATSSTNYGSYNLILKRSNWNSQNSTEEIINTFIYTDPTGTFKIQDVNETESNTMLTLDKSGNAVFGGSVTATNFIGSIPWASIADKPTVASGWLTDVITTAGGQTISGDLNVTGIAEFFDLRGETITSSAGVYLKPIGMATSEILSVGSPSLSYYRSIWDGSNAVLKTTKLFVDETGNLVVQNENGTDVLLIDQFGKISSKVADGTAPFSVLSKTLVANLNSERVNGVKITVGKVAPASPSEGDIWFDTN